MSTTLTLPHQQVVALAEQIDNHLGGRYDLDPEMDLDEHELSLLRFGQDIAELVGTTPSDDAMRHGIALHIPDATREPLAAFLESVLIPTYASARTQARRISTR